MKNEKRIAEILRNGYTEKPALLIGNGINRVTSDGISWEGILDNLVKKSGVKNVRVGSKPLVFLFEELVHKMPRGGEKDNIRKLKEFVREEIDDHLKPNALHGRLVKLNIEHYLTTNYDYCLEKAYWNYYLEKEVDTDVNMSVFERNDPDSIKYSLSRCNRAHNKSIWHIHGELDNGAIKNTDSTYPEKSIMLGFDQYGRYVDRILQVFYYLHEQINPDTGPLQKSFTENDREGKWIQFLFTHDLHIMGLDLGLFETHLWWLVNFRAMLNDRHSNCVKNTITYYLPSFELLLKRDQLDLLKSFRVEVVGIPCDFNDGNFYEEFYSKTIGTLEAKYGATGKR